MLKRLVLLFSLLADTAPAQVPPVPDVDRTITYNVGAATSQFGVPFPVYGDCTDLAVTVNGVAQQSGGFYCTSASGLALNAIARPITDLSINLTLPVASGTVAITSLYRPRNLVVPTAPGISRTEFERTINGILSGMRDLYHAYGSVFPPPQIYGSWALLNTYPQNAVVNYNGILYQALQASIGEVPAQNPAYWQQIAVPASNITFNDTQAVGTETAIAAATVTDLGTITSHFASITGAATITNFGSSCSAVSPIYFVTFAGVVTLTYNASSLILPGAANIVTAAGDSAVMNCLGSGNWQVMFYNRAAQPPGFPSGAVVAFNLASCPAGWEPSDSTNGTIDVRGTVVRGLDNLRNLDPGRTLGSYQPDQMQSFNISVASTTTITGIPGGGGTTVSAPVTNTAQAPSGVALGSETRVKNVALLYCQKI